jgi:glycosyltransferase involved in cell wall biosynthesis
LQNSGYEVLAAAPVDAYSERVVDLGCRFIPLPMRSQSRSPVHDSALFLRYLNILRRERPDAFLGYTIKPNVYGSLAAHRLGIPAINNISGLGTAFIRDRWVTRVARGLYRVALRPSRTVFFQNAEDRRLFVHQGIVSLAQTALLPGSGIDLRRFQPRSSPGDGGGQQATRFLFVGRLLKDKGIVDYVEAARIVRKASPGTVFQVLGFLESDNDTAIGRTEVEAWTREGSIEYLGAADDVRPYYAAADCIVLPSYREGTPRTLLEGAAMGKPLIATDVPGCREVVEDQVNGFLCQVRSPEDLAAKMLQFLAQASERRRAMASASRAKAECEFDEQIVVDRYLTSLARIFGGGGV